MARRPVYGPLIGRWFRSVTPRSSISGYRRVVHWVLVRQFRCERWWRERVTQRNVAIVQLQRRLRGTRRIGDWVVCFYGPSVAQNNLKVTGYWLASRPHPGDPTDVRSYSVVASEVNGGVVFLGRSDRLVSTPTALSSPLLSRSRDIECDRFFADAQIAFNRLESALLSGAVILRLGDDQNG